MPLIYLFSASFRALINRSKPKRAMPRKSINSNEEIQKLRDALAHSETERLKLNEQYTEIRKQLQASLEGNKTLLNLLVELQTKLDIVLVQTKKRNKKEFGAKTENHNPRHSSGANQDDNDIVEPSKEDQDSPTEIVKEKVNRNHKKHIHDDSNLPKKAVPHKVSHDKSKCPTCSIDTKFVRNELTYQLERIVHTVEKLEHQQEVRSCPKCKTYIVTAEKPDAPFPGALCGPGLLASVIVDKIADGLPNYRQAKRFKRSAHTIPRSTQSDWSLAGAATLPVDLINSFLMAQKRKRVAMLTVAGISLMRKLWRSPNVSSFLTCIKRSTK